MNCTHHCEPFGGRAFGRDALANFVIKNLCAAAGQAVKSSLFQTREDGFVIEFRDEMNVVNLWRREAVQLKVRIFQVKSTQQILVPFNSEIRVKAALHQNARAAKCNRFVNLPENLLK